MDTAVGAGSFVPSSTDLDTLAAAAARCEGCELFRDATQTVFGQGSATATMMLVGEQPGDSEDKAGEPFVGPAGRLLDRALEEAGIDRSTVYVTNAVKHFRFTTTADSARRLHAKPSNRHVTACHPWLEAELTALTPEVVVALGAIAAQALLGPKFRVTQQHGQRLEWPPLTGLFAGSPIPIGHVIATIHPSAVLRARTPADRETAYTQLVDDLRVVIPG